MTAEKKNDGLWDNKLQWGFVLAVLAFMFWSGYAYKQLGWAADRVDLLITRERELRERLDKLEVLEHSEFTTIEKRLDRHEQRLFGDDQSDERWTPKGRVYQQELKNRDGQQ